MRGNAIRKPVLIVVISGAILVVALLCWYFISERTPGRFETPGQRTNILLFMTSQGEITDPFIVLSVGAGSDDLFLFVPPDVRVKLSDLSFSRLGDGYAEVGVEGVRDRLTGLLGVELPYYLVIDEPSFKWLVDEFGGLTVDVEAEVVYLDRSADPPVEVHIRPGGQRFDGETAIAYLRGRSDVDRTARGQRLLQAIVADGFVGREAGKVDRIVRSLKGKVVTNLSLRDLRALSDSIRGIPLDRLRMPVIPGDEVTIDGETYLRPKVVEMERIVAGSLKGLELLTPSEVNVAVFNGNGIRMMATRTADYLRARGFRVTRIGNADTFSYETSYIVVLSDEAKGWVLRDALPSRVKIVFPDAFADHYEALKELIPMGTDLILIAGAGLEIGE